MYVWLARTADKCSADYVQGLNLSLGRLDCEDPREMLKRMNSAAEGTHRRIASQGEKAMATVIWHAPDRTSGPVWRPRTTTAPASSA